MRPLQLTSAVLVLLALVGCVEAPAHDPAEEHALASIVALLTGYDSDGLASRLKDLVEDSLTSESVERFIVPVSGAATSPGRLLARSRSGASALGESRTRYALRPATTVEPGAGTGIAVELDGASLHASTSLSIRATSHGIIEIVSVGRLLERSATGELRIDGALGERPGDGVPFSHVEATLTWNHLRLLEDPSGEGLRMQGSIAISIAARGARGLVIRNGTLRLRGDESAVLDLGGRHHRIDIRRSRMAP